MVIGQSLFCFLSWKHHLRTQRTHCQRPITSMPKSSESPKTLSPGASCGGARAFPLVVVPALAFGLDVVDFLFASGRGFLSIFGSTLHDKPPDEASQASRAFDTNSCFSVQPKHTVCCADKYARSSLTRILLKSGATIAELLLRTAETATSKNLSLHVEKKDIIATSGAYATV